MPRPSFLAPLPSVSLNWALTSQVYSSPLWAKTPRAYFLELMKPSPDSFALPSSAILPVSRKDPGSPSVPRSARKLPFWMTPSRYHVKPSVLPFGGQTILVCQLPSKRSAGSISFHFLRGGF